MYAVTGLVVESAQGGPVLCCAVLCCAVLCCGTQSPFQCTTGREQLTVAAMSDFCKVNLGGLDDDTADTISKRHVLSANLLAYTVLRFHE